MKKLLVKKIAFVLILAAAGAASFPVLSGGSLFADNSPVTDSSVKPVNAPLPQSEAGTEKNPAVIDKKAQSDENSRADAGKIFLFDWFVKGGFFMWPILICAALAMGFIIERFLAFRKAGLNPREFVADFEKILNEKTIADAEKFCAEKNIPMSHVLLKGLKLRRLGFDHVERGISAAGSIEVASLEKGLNILSALGNIAPLLGFLGTVSGMITAFQSIAAADQVSARLVAGGIYEALITTEAGLVVAIPVLAFYNYFVHRIEYFVSEIERLAADIAEKLLSENA